MVKKDTSGRVRSLFFEFPSRTFGVRELSRLVGVSHPSAKGYLLELEKEGLISPVQGRGWRANGSEWFRLSKKLDMIRQLYRSGLIEHIRKETLPRVIILFGSASRGEDDKSSDIDLFIESSPKDLNVRRFERVLKRPVKMTYGNLKKLNKEFLNSILNGVILFGGIEQ